MYKFPVGLYPVNITYHYARSLFVFFQDQTQTKEFFKYLFFRIESEDTKRKNGEDVCVHVLRNDSNVNPLIDLNYNFVVLVLSEWIAHYSIDKTVTHKYKKYGKSQSKDDDGNAIKFNTKRELEIECSIQERVMFDYSFSGWLISNSLHRNFRYDFVQLLMNNILGKHTAVPAYQYRNKAATTKPVTVFDAKRNVEVMFVATTFFRSALAKYLSKKNMESLREMSNHLERVSGKKAVRNKETNEFEIDGKQVLFCDYFDIKNIEKTRDLGDGKYHVFKPSADEEKMIDESGD